MNSEDVTIMRNTKDGRGPEVQRLKMADEHGILENQTTAQPYCTTQIKIKQQIQFLLELTRSKDFGKKYFRPESPYC